MILKKQIKKIGLLVFLGLSNQGPLLFAENDKNVLITFFNFDNKTGLHQAPSFYDRDALRDESKILNNITTDVVPDGITVSEWLFNKLTNKDTLNPQKIDNKELAKGIALLVKETKLLVKSLFLKSLWDYLVSGGAKEEKDLVWCLSQSNNPKHENRNFLDWKLPAENDANLNDGLNNFSRTKAILKEIRTAAQNKVSDKNANNAKANESSGAQSLSESDEFLLFKKDLSSNRIIKQLDRGKNAVYKYYSQKQSLYGEKSIEILSTVTGSIEKLDASLDTLCANDITSGPENILYKINDAEKAIASFESSRFESNNKSHQIVIKELRKIRVFNSLRKLCESLIAEQSTDFHKEFSIKTLEKFRKAGSNQEILNLLRNQKLDPDMLLSNAGNKIQTLIQESFELDRKGKNYITPAEAFNFLVIATSALTCGVSYGVYKLGSFIKSKLSKKEETQSQDQNDAPSAEENQIDPALEATLKEYEEALQEKVEQEG